jgi:hypothetical protein
VPEDPKTQPFPTVRIFASSRRSGNTKPCYIVARVAKAAESQCVRQLKRAPRGRVIEGDEVRELTPFVVKSVLPEKGARVASGERCSRNLRAGCFYASIKNLQRRYRDAHPNRIIKQGEQLLDGVVAGVLNSASGHEGWRRCGCLGSEARRGANHLPCKSKVLTANLTRRVAASGRRLLDGDVGVWSDGRNFRE